MAIIKMSIGFQNRHGSNAGRGFRYQDAVAAWLCIRTWAGIDPPAMIIPEGGDDVERLAEEGSSLIQVKSRREHLGPVPASEIRTFIAALWDRQDEGAISSVGLELIIERPIADQVTATDGTIPLGSLLLPKGRPQPSQAHLNTVIRQVASPNELALAIIVKKTDCLPIVAQLCFAQLLKRVGELADDNGRRVPGDYRGMSPTDVDGLINDTLAVVDVASLQYVINCGICEAVDFLTPLNDPQFYLGMDVQPGHVAAGLVISQVQTRKAVIDGLEANGAALVAGPSGAGKSAIMWDTAHALRHTIRWYRLLRADTRDIAAVKQFLKNLRADPGSPVGLIIDDVGRRGTEAWDAYTREFAVVSGALLLGSIREEDLFLIEARSRATEVRAEATEETALHIFEDLKKKQKTSWAGWKEAWAQSEGLLLEYVHILTAGQRFANLLAEQVSARRRDPHRDIELSLLRILALTGAAGTAAEPDRLANALDASEEEISRGLSRLVDEHLVREAPDGMLTGLHQRRSSEVVRLTHAMPPPSIDATFARAMGVVNNDGVEALISEALRNQRIALSSAIPSMLARLDTDPNVEVLAAMLRGLSGFHISSAIENWLTLPSTRRLKPTQISLAELLSHAPDDIQRLSETLGAALDAAKDLRSIRQDFSKDPRIALLAVLPSAILEKAFLNADAFGISRLLASQVGIPLDRQIAIELAKRPVDLLTAPFDEVVDLLGTLEQIEHDCAAEWVAELGESDLTSRISKELPWTTAVVFKASDDGQVAHCDYQFVEQREEGQVHKSVLEICHALLALSPRSKIAECCARTFSGEPLAYGGYAVAHKTITRENLPTRALPAWNRRWAEAAAQQVAAPSYTDFLSRAAKAMDMLVAALEPSINLHLRGKKEREDLKETLRDVHREAELLTSPSTGAFNPTGEPSRESNIYSSPLQSLLFTCSLNVLPELKSYPKDSARSAYGLGELIKQYRRATDSEPWELIGGVPSSYVQLGKLLEQLRWLALEAAHTGACPTTTHSSLLSNSISTKVLQRLTNSVRARATIDRLEFAETLGHQIAECGIVIKPHSFESSDPMEVWPCAHFAIEVRIESMEDLETFMLVPFLAKEFKPDLHRLAVLPTVSGLAIPELAQSVTSVVVPSPADGWTWVNRLGLEASPSYAWTAVHGAMTIAIALNAMDKLELGLNQRPQGEIAAREELAAQLNAAEARIQTIVTPLGAGLEATALAFIRICRMDNVGDLTVDPMTYSLGSISPLIKIAIDLRTKLEQAELDHIRASQSFG